MANPVSYLDNNKVYVPCFRKYGFPTNKATSKARVKFNIPWTTNIDSDI